MRRWHGKADIVTRASLNIKRCEYCQALRPLRKRAKSLAGYHYQSEAYRACSTLHLANSHHHWTTRLTKYLLFEKDSVLIWFEERNFAKELQRYHAVGQDEAHL